MRKSRDCIFQTVRDFAGRATDEVYRQPVSVDRSNDLDLYKSLAKLASGHFRFLSIIYVSNYLKHVVVVVVVVRLEHSHSFIDSFDNHSTASGPASCRRSRPPGNAVSGHSKHVNTTLS